MTNEMAQGYEAGSETAAPFAERFAALPAGLIEGEPGWLRELREGGLTRFQALGLPTPKAEAWKYTNLRPLEKAGFAPGASGEHTASIDWIPTLVKENPARHRMVFVNGRLRPDYSALDALPAGVTLEPLATTLAERPDLLEPHLGQIGRAEEQAMLALNSAFMEDGFVLRIGAGTALQEPIEVVSIGGLSEQPLAYHPRNLILLDDNSQATLIEQHVGLGRGSYLANGATEIRLGQGAILRHIKLQTEAETGFHLNTTHMEVARDATYDAFGLSAGGQLARNEIAVRLNGTGAHCQLGGAYMVRGQQHCDNTTVIEHIAPQATSREVFKGVLDDKARAVFQGRIIVHRDAQQTDGHQLSKALLLSDGAEIDAKPELEIYADDVKCSHGATAGELDNDALFYLRARGIPEPAARRLLIQAFLAEALEEIKAEEVRAALTEKIEDWLTATDSLDGGAA